VYYLCVFFWVSTRSDDESGFVSISGNESQGSNALLLCGKLNMMRAPSKGLELTPEHPPVHISNAKRNFSRGLSSNTQCVALADSQTMASPTSPLNPERHSGAVETDGHVSGNFVDLLVLSDFLLYCFVVLEHCFISRVFDVPGHRCDFNTAQ
jgi:hypothetical protein